MQNQSISLAGWELSYLATVSKAATLLWCIIKGLKIWATTGASQSFKLLTHCGSLPSQLREWCGFSLVKKKTRIWVKHATVSTSAARETTWRASWKSEMMLVLRPTSWPRKNQEDHDWHGREVKRTGPQVRGESEYCPWRWPKGSPRAEYSKSPMFRQTKTMAMASWRSSFWSSFGVSDRPKPGTPSQTQHLRKNSLSSYTQKHS